jgi:enoyl-CoA hydratase
MQLSVESGVAHVKLSRPEARNSLSVEMIDDLLRICLWLDTVDDIAVVVLASSGPHFCVGTDMPDTEDVHGTIRRLTRLQRLVASIEALDQVTLAVVDGYAVGGGFELTLAADLVLCSDSSLWGLPEVDLGMTPGWGGVAKVAEVVGRRRARQILLLGSIFPGSKAVEWGFWHHMVPADDLAQEQHEVVSALLLKDRQTLRQLKLLLRGMPVDGVAGSALELFSAALSGAFRGGVDVEDSDRGAGLKSFYEQGPPWTDRRAASRALWTE